MPIKAACSCGHSFQAASKYAGKTVKCPKCKKPLKIPAAKSTSKKAPAGESASGKIAVKCKCGKAFSAKPELAGKKVKCPGCGEPIVIKAKSKSASAKAKSKSASAEKQGPSDAIGDLFDEVGFAVEKGGGQGKKCPECKSPMKEEAILCIECGYNENLGKKMETYRPVTAADRARRADVLVESDSKGDKKGKKKSRWWPF